MPRVARVLLLAIAVPLFASAFVARAQGGRGAGGDALTLAGAFTLGGVLQRTSAHGCSQSFASSDDRAVMQLAVDAHDRVTLTIDVRHYESFGPSPGRYAAGERDVTHTTELGHAELRGSAVRTAAGITLRFERMRESHVRFHGYGTLPLPAPTESAVSYGLRCELASLEVLPAVPSEDERTTTRPLLRCTAEGAIAPLAAFETLTPIFGPRSGVRLHASRGMWSDEETTELRIAD